MSPATPLVPFSLRRLAVAGVLLPAAMVAVDRLLLYALAGAWRTERLVILTMAVFVFQIGLMGIVCARWIDWPPLRWIIYGWCWVLVDFQTLTAWVFADMIWWGESFQGAALFSAQLGLVTIWAVLGTTRWTIRLPVAIVLAAVLIVPLLHLRYSGNNASVFFAVQVLTLVGICGVLRWQGFRLIAPQAGHGSLDGTERPADLQTAQFGLRHVLVWTTALALILGFIRVVGLPFEQWADVRYRHWLLDVSEGAGVGIVLIIALWAALGRVSAWQWWFLALVVVPGIGLVAGMIAWLPWWWQVRRAAIPWAAHIPWWSWQFWQLFFDNEKYRIAWIYLAGGMLLATLLFPRALGYRLARPANDDP